MKTIRTIIALSVAATMTAFVPVALAADEKPEGAPHKSHHEGPPPAAGEIVTISKDSIEIKDHKGDTHKFDITGDTKYGTAKEPVGADSFKVGEHVLVHYTKANDKSVATIIRELPPHNHEKTGAAPPETSK